jgi:hypothetical protein
VLFVIASQRGLTPDRRTISLSNATALMPSASLELPTEDSNRVTRSDALRTFERRNRGTGVRKVNVTTHDLAAVRHRMGDAISKLKALTSTRSRLCKKRRPLLAAECSQAGRKGSSPNTDESIEMAQEQIQAEDKKGWVEPLMILGVNSSTTSFSLGARRDCEAYMSALCWGW